MEEPSQSTTSQRCRNGCGFYGTAQNEGMCSKCYKDNVQQKNPGSSDMKSPSALPVKPDIASASNSKPVERPVDKAVSGAMGSLATKDSSYSSKSGPVASTSTTTSASLFPPSSDIDSGDIMTSLQDSAMSIPSSPVSARLTTSDSDDSPAKPKKNRCAACRKRIGLTGFNCRCGNIFCGIHRYSDQHNCDYDYRADAQAKIRKENPVVAGEKVKKI